MAHLTTGGDDWITNIITSLRFDFGNSPEDTYVVDWISVGKESVADLTADHIAAGIAGQGALATRDTVGATYIDAGSITLVGCAPETIARMFSDATVKANIEAWRKAGSPTYMDGEYIFAHSITADKFISTLYGDMNQAMSYVKTVLGAGDEYEHDLTAADLAAGIHSDIDALTHADYGLSIRLATAKRWDEVGAVWDTGTWDEPTKASGSWTSASTDLGSLKTLQMALRYTLFEENPASTTPTIKGIYLSDVFGREVVDIQLADQKGYVQIVDFEALRGSTFGRNEKERTILVVDESQLLTSHEVDCIMAVS